MSNMFVSLCVCVRVLKLYIKFFDIFMRWIFYILNIVNENFNSNIINELILGKKGKKWSRMAPLFGQIKGL